jgi:hypothetical protein
MSAGNSDQPFGWPSQIDAAFAVAGRTPNGAKWSGSHYGAWVDISAAGSFVPLLDPSGAIFLGEGTSCSAPAVTGTAALLLSEDPSLPMPDQRRVLQLGSVNMDALAPGFVGQLGAGFVNTEGALRQLLPAVSLGSALPGATAPSLHAYGGSTQGQTFAFSISGGPPSAPAALIVGTSTIDAPGFGGVVVPSFDLVVFVALDADGRWHVEFPLPVGLPAGTPVAWLQALVKDAGAPAGVALTGAVRIQGP